MRPRFVQIVVGRGLFWAGLVVATAFIVFPVYWMVMLSVQPYGFSRSIDPSLLPETITLSNYGDALSGRPMDQWLMNSLVLAVGVALVSVVIGGMAAYSLARFSSRAGWVLGFAVLCTQMLPPTTLIIPMYALFLRFGILDTQFALFVAHSALTLPLVVWILRGFFRQVPVDLEEASMVDGCSRFQAFRRIALPLAVPGLIATGMYAFVDSWNDFLYARTLASPVRLWTSPVGLASFRTEVNVAFEPLMAASVLVSLPVIVVFYLLQRYLVSGWTEGAVKG